MSADMQQKLTRSEMSRLSELELAVQRGQQTFIEVGNALAEIREARLYRETYDTFEAYCRERWGWSRPRAYQFIDAAKTANGLSTVVDTPAPSSERQVRPLTKLKTNEDQYAAWVRANEIAEDERTPVTGQVVARAVEEIQPRKAAASFEQVAIVVAESHADKAIQWLNEIDMSQHGALEAVQKVKRHCESLIRSISS